MDRTLNAWEPTRTADAAPDRVRGLLGSWGGTAILAVRTSVLLVLATVAILVLLPAALAAQAALLG